MPARSSSEPLSGASASGVSKTMAFFNFDGASSEAEEGLFVETDRRRSSVPLESPSNLPANASVHGTAATEVEEAPPAGQATLPDQRSGSMTSQPSEMDRDKKASSHRAPYAPTFVDLRTATEQRKRKLEDTAIEDFNTNAAMGTEHTPWFTSEITSAMTGSYRKIAETGSSEAPKAPASRARGVSDPESNWFDARVPGQSDSEAPSHGAEAADLTSSVTLAQDDSLLAEAARRPSREREARASHSSNLATEVNGNAPSTLETLASNWWQQGAAQTPWLSGISPSNPALRRATVIGNLRSTNEPYEHSELIRDPPSSEAAGQYSFQPQPHDGWYQEDLETVHPTSSGLGESSSFEGRRRSRPTAIATAALASTATTQPHAESTGLTSNPIAPLPARRTIPAGGSANLSGSADYGAHFGAFLRSCEQNVGPPQLALEHYAPSSPATASFFAGAATMASSMPNAAPAALPSASTGRSTPALVAGSSRSGGVSTPLSWDERPDEFDIQRQARIRASTHAGSYGYNVMSGAADPGFWEPLDRDAFTVNQALSYDTPQRSLRVESMPGTQNPFRSAAYAQQARSGAYASPAAIQARQAQTYGQADAGSSHQAAGASRRPLAAT
ncbi:hypothetical protein CBOM_01145 [Ceraceosorus bombacis]|uniref:Uncharacterized protein n=1 Tax=Ceraceosorus bombacis TaxID=401625 RepID=A0A0P1BBY7_9BASI|nr:hypothetical protein CBOM_01145 [Ceraceosorus bombacis]